MKGKPDLNAFLDGGAAAAAEAPVRSNQEADKRITKTIRIGLSVESALKRAAFERSQASGKRVTESDVIEEALRKYLNI